MNIMLTTYKMPCHTRHHGPRGTKQAPPLTASLVSGRESKGSNYPDKNNGQSISVTSLRTDFIIMQQAVAKCPSIEIKFFGRSIPSLFDSRSIWSGKAILISI